jgi:hypothetical protein
MSAVLTPSSSKVPIPVAERSKADRSMGLRVRISPGAWMFVLFCTVKDKRQSQDNQDKEVQIKYRDKKNPAVCMDVSLASVVF